METFLLIALAVSCGYALCLIVNKYHLSNNRIVIDTDVAYSTHCRLHHIDQSGIYSDNIKRVGCFQDGTKPPEYAEQLTKSDCCTQVKTKGKFGGNKSSYDHVIYRCPKCSELHELEFRHGDVVKCKKCYLISQTHGNGLTVWESWNLK